jgi:hypothetical protein
MELRVTTAFQRQFDNLRDEMRTAFNEAFEKLFENPKLVWFEKKSGIDVWSMILPDGNRVAFAQDAAGQFIPAFVGNHRDYETFLRNGVPRLRNLTSIDLPVNIPVDSLNNIGKAGRINYYHAQALTPPAAPVVPHAPPEPALDQSALRALIDNDHVEHFADRRTNRVYTYDPHQNAVIAIDAEARTAQIVASGDNARSFFDNKWVEVSIELGEEKFAPTHKGRLSHFLDDLARGGGALADAAELAGKGARVLSKTLKILGPLGIAFGAAVGTAEAAELGSRAQTALEHNAISRDAVAAYDALLAAHIAQCTGDPSAFGGELAVQAAFNEWAEFYNVPPFVQNSLRPDSLFRSLFEGGEQPIDTFAARYGGLANSNDYTGHGTFTHSVLATSFIGQLTDFNDNGQVDPGECERLYRAMGILDDNNRAEISDVRADGQYNSMDMIFTIRKHLIELNENVWRKQSEFKDMSCADIREQMCNDPNSPLPLTVTIDGEEVELRKALEDPDFVQNYIEQLEIMYARGDADYSETIAALRQLREEYALHPSPQAQPAPSATAAAPPSPS